MKAWYSTTKTCVVALMLAAVTSIAFAQAPYPNQQVRIICAFPAGGGTDTFARPIAARVSDEVFSLPLHPALPEAHVDLVAEALTAIAPR